MPCRPIVIDGRAVGFACGPRPRPSPCVVCRRPGGFLCDFPLSGEKAGQTCDRALCIVHAWRPSEGVDYCPAHRAMHETQGAEKER